jgi:hypothetical protein
VGFAVFELVEVAVQELLAVVFQHVRRLLQSVFVFLKEEKGYHSYQL